MKLKIKFMNLDKPNRNNQIFTKSAIECACKEIEDSSLPLVYISDIDKEGGRSMIGAATLQEENYPDVKFQALITDDTLKTCLENNEGGFTIGGLAMFDTNDNPKNIQTANVLRITSLGYCKNPGYESSFEIINEVNTDDT